MTPATEIRRTEYDVLVREVNGRRMRLMLDMEGTVYPLLKLRATEEVDADELLLPSSWGSPSAYVRGPSRTMVMIEATVGDPPGMPRTGASLNAQRVEVVGVLISESEEEALAYALMGHEESETVLAVEPATVQMQVVSEDPGMCQVTVQGPQVNGGKR